MTDRNRAWRRRKTRQVMSRLNNTKEWLLNQLQEDRSKPPIEVKRHKPGKLTPVQDMRQAWSLNQQLVDGM